jgi:hypothetical protein
MKRLLIALGLILASTAAFAGNYPPVPYVTAPVEAGTAPFNNVITSVNTNSTGLLFGLYAPVTATAAATTQTLGSYTLPASYLTTVGQALRIKGVFTFAANSNNRTPIITFGTFTYTGTVNATSSGTEGLECLVVKTGASTQEITCTGMTQTTPIIYSAAAGSSTDTAGIAITGQCTQGSASADCTLATFTVESLR